MMQEQVSFPRGGGHHHGRQTTSGKDSTTNDDTNDKQSRRQKKRKSSSAGDDDDDKEASTTKSIKTDFLFGTKSKKSDDDKNKTSSSKRRKKGDIDPSASGNSSSSKQSLLPLGGGGVVMSTKKRHAKKGDSTTASATATSVMTTPIIEALSFSKLAKGTKLLACVRQVQDEFAIVSLPNLLTAYILPQQEVGGYPLKHTLTVGQTLAVAIQKVATEPVKGGSGVSRKRIQVTPLPQAINPRSLLMGGDDEAVKRDKMSSATALAANRLARSSIPVRGQIVSIEDHGCVVDLGFGARGFVKFDNIQEGGQNNYVIVEGDEDEVEEDLEGFEEEDKAKVPKVILQKGRLYDFLVLPVSTSSSSSTDSASAVFPLSLLSISKFSDSAVSSVSGSSNSKSRHKKKIVPTTSSMSMSSLTPGWLVHVKVEALATNGLCVSFFDNVFRGAMEMNHLGATLIPTSKDGGPSDNGWKSLALSMFHKHQTFLARIMAVDVPTKLVRLSMAPHVLNLGHVTDITSSLSGFPAVGSVVTDCTVIKLDPGIGALLALPSQYNYVDSEDALMSTAIAKSSELFSDSSFQEACQIRKVYVHISKALDEAEEGDAKDSAAIGKFHKEFAPSTKHSVRILSTDHWIEGVAAGACAPSILEAHVMSHDDLVAGKVYKQVPVCAHMQGGSVMVQLGGISKKNKKRKGSADRGISGLIPPLQLFDSTSSGSSEYRKRVVQAKYAVDSKIDVRVLWVDPLRKKCLVTAKKTIVHAPSEHIITSYGDLKVGQVAVGYVSRIDDESLYVTFCNKVYGRVTARSLATELGVNDLNESYSVGDVVTCRVVTLKRTFSKDHRSHSSESVEMEDDEVDPSAQDTRREYWELILSLKANLADGGDTLLEASDIDIKNPETVRLQPGAILPKKAMKIVKLVDGREKKSGGYTPGYAIVLIKSKYLVDKNHPSRSKMTETIECKLPYDQLMDQYDPLHVQSATSLNEMAAHHLMAGKKINQKGIVLVDPNKSNVEYSSGLGRMAVVSLRKQMINSKEERDEGVTSGDENSPFVPTLSTELFVGALVIGYVTQIDPRFGGFVRFLDGMTGLITKKQGGIRLPLFNTVVARVKAIDDSFKPHRILLELHSSQNRLPSSDEIEDDSLDVGDILAKATVSDIDFFQATLRIAGRKSKKEQFILHCTNKDASAASVKHRKKPLPSNQSRQISKCHPFYGINKGHEFERLKVVSVKRRKDRVDIFVSDNLSEMDLASDENPSMHFIDQVSQLNVGAKVHAVVVGYAKNNKGVVVQVGPSARGFIPSLELSRDLDVMNHVSSDLALGTVLECRVMDRDQWFKNRIACPLPSFFKNKLEKNLKKEEVDDQSLFLSVLSCSAENNVPLLPSEGDLVVGRINRFLPQIQAPSLTIELRGGFVGRCCITELDESDEWLNMPLGKPSVVTPKKHIDEKHGGNELDSSTSGKKYVVAEGDEPESQGSDLFSDGEYVECRILALDLVKNQIDVSLRPSRIQGDIDDDPEPQAGDIVQGFVIATNKKGCFVRMSRKVEGRSTIKEICDGFLPNPGAAFPSGRLVVGKVKNARKVTSKGNHLKGAVRLQVDLDMRESVLLQEQDNRLSFDDISTGEKHKGTVQRVEDYGVFVRIENSNISGLAHVSECSDNFVKNLSSLFNPGDPVKVLVIKKDDEQQQIGFSMKPSHFEYDEDSSESSVDSDLEMVSEDEDVDMEDVRELQDDSDDVAEGNDIDSDDEDFATKLATKMNDENDKKDSPSDSDDSDDDSDSSSYEEDAAVPSVLDTDVGFTWGAGALEKLQNHSENRDSDSSDDSDANSDSEDEEDGENGPSKSHKSRKRQAQKRREEQETARREMALADGTADENPETASDFERLLAGEPNNSELWIRYMAFHLSLADIPAARRVADKALERIEFRQEREKLNVWSAVLQLEHKYGSEETFNAAIESACNQSNSKQVYLRACEILEKDLESRPNDPTAVSRVDSLFATMCKKHKSKKQTWLAHMQYLLRNLRHQEAHAMMKRAMLSLAPYKHAETMSKFAQMEFELGSSERARTLFDGLLVKYPKRLDMFFVYLDKEVKYGKIGHARSMLEKKVEERKLSDKQMKSLFKKWYKMEEEHGTEETQDHVKESARRYVSSG